jgi:hypothetical protein
VKLRRKGPSRVPGLKSCLKRHLGLAWMRAVVPGHVDVAIVRPAYMTREVVTEALEFTTAVIAVGSCLELEVPMSSVTS